jgi:hypothetical protein
VSNSDCDGAIELQLDEAVLASFVPGTVSVKRSEVLAACGFNDAYIAAPGLWYTVTGTGKISYIYLYNQLTSCRKSLLR